MPMATDIAFALAILAVVGSALPTSLRAFLLTLGDRRRPRGDPVIATVFTADLSLLWLLGAPAPPWSVGAAAVAPDLRLVPLRPARVLCWWCVLQSGVHATIAGVAARAADAIVRRTDGGALIDRWEHLWRPVSAGFAVPVFALLVAGISVAPASLARLATEPVALGIIAGLVLGKTIGVFGGSYLTARFTRAELAPDLRWREVAAGPVLAGVGFTVSLLIAELAFEGTPQLQADAKTAVLVASLLAAVVGAALLRRRNRARRTDDESAPEPAA